MLNPTFFQLDTQDGEMRLQTARLDRADPRILDDIGLTDAEWASATGSSSASVLLAVFLEKVRQVVLRRPPHAAAVAVALTTTTSGHSASGPKAVTDGKCKTGRLSLANVGQGE
jgi:hypothetical protein